jgi:hypothetical protein
VTYETWFEAHASKHESLTKKLVDAGLSRDEIIAYFDFENMRLHEPDFCELYKTNTKCHTMDELNCYLCACPNFRFYETPKIEGEKQVHSTCSINSKDGNVFEHENNLHQDCSGCIIPHKEHYIQEHFDLEWKKIMKACVN